MASARLGRGIRLATAIMTSIPTGHDPLLRQRLGRSEPLLWLNPALAPAAEALAGQAVTWDEVRSASAAFEHWRPVLRRLFPRGEVTAV